MDRLTDDAKKAAAAGWLAQTNNSADSKTNHRQEQEKRFQQARARAQRLAAQLAPLFPVVASQTRTPGALQGWVDSWARQIVSAKLTDEELLEGLKGVVDAVAQAGNPPLSFSLFLSACRPNSHLSGQDAEARERHPLLLSRDLTSDENWCSARDHALAKLRALGYFKGSKPE